MPAREFTVKNFADLSPAQRKGYAPRANYKIDGENGDWEEAIDYPFGYGVRHVAVLGEDGQIKFDKLNVIQRGIFVVPIRITPDQQVETYLQKETRLLLRDSTGKQGSTVIENIPQGAVNVDETEAQAVMREVLEETGYRPSALALIGRVGFDIPNSESLFNFYLALVPYQCERQELHLDDTESIDYGHWYSFKEVNRKQFIDGKTIIGLTLAQKVIQEKYLK